MLSKTFQFDKGFQIGILGLMSQNLEFLLTALDLVKPEYFEDPILVWTFQAIRDYYLDYKTRCTQMVLENELQKDVRAGRVKEDEVPQYWELFNQLVVKQEEEQYIISEVVRFCRRQEVRRAMLDCAPLVESADEKIWDEIETKVRGACNVGTHAIDLGCQYFLEYPERLRLRMLGEEVVVIPTGITELDYKLNGGLRGGQIGIWLGGTGSGKSIALPHCGKRAIVGGSKVVHYSLELSEEDVALRYDSSWTTVPIHDLNGQNLVVEKRLEKLHARYGNSLIIKEYPSGVATVNTIRTHLSALRHSGFIPDLIIVDYGDLLKPLTSYQDEYADLGSIFRDLRGIAMELKIPLWTATQVNRPGMSQEIVDVEHIADSFRKAQIADVIIAICASREELQNDILRLFLAKNRNGPSKHTVKIRSAYNRMCFYQPIAQPIGEMPVPQGGPPPGLPNAPRRKPRAES